MPEILSDLLTLPKSAWLLFAVSTGALAFAFVMQFGFDVEPCILCLWQRVPFAVAAAFTLATALWKPYGKQTQVLLGLSALAYAINSGLAIFHTGVERHWWLGTSGCSIHPLDAGSIADLREQLLHTVVARCDQISWTFLGLSMANWNIPFSLALTLFALMAIKKSSFSTR
jgi:disulfide bond formation protein DsbB